MKSIKQLTEGFRTYHDWFSSVPHLARKAGNEQLSYNGGRGGKVISYKPMEGESTHPEQKLTESLKTGKPHFVKELADEAEMHQHTLGSRVMEHFGLRTTNPEPASLELANERGTIRHVLTSQWNPDLVPPPVPSHPRKPTPFTQHQAHQYAMHDVLGSAMGMSDYFNIFGSHASNIKMDSKTGDLVGVDLDDAFSHPHYSMSPYRRPYDITQETHDDINELTNRVEHRAEIRKHILENHPEAYGAAIKHIESVYHDPEASRALQEHFQRHAPVILSSNKASAVDAYRTAFHNRLKATIGYFRDLR